MSLKEERDARLDLLADATTAWATKRRKALEKEAADLKKLLKGRTGSERMNNATATAASDLLVEEIDEFLTGQ